MQVIVLFYLVPRRGQGEQRTARLLLLGPLPAGVQVLSRGRRKASARLQDQRRSNPGRDRIHTTKIFESPWLGNLSIFLFKLS
jgi:hypothetical protein